MSDRRRPRSRRRWSRSARRSRSPARGAEPVRLAEAHRHPVPVADDPGDPHFCVPTGDQGRHPRPVARHRQDWISAASTQASATSGAPPRRSTRTAPDCRAARSRCHPSGSMAGSTAPGARRLSDTVPSARARARLPPSIRTAAASRCAETWIASGAAPRLSVIVSESPGIGVSSSPEQEAEAGLGQHERSGRSTAVERVAMGIGIERARPPTVISTRPHARAGEALLELGLHAVERRRNRAPTRRLVELDRGGSADIHGHGLRRERDILGDGRHHRQREPRAGCSVDQGPRDARRGVRARGEPPHVGHEELP